MYSGGHTIASVGGTFYDLTTGLTGGFSNSDYVVGKALGNKRYEFVVDGKTAGSRQTRRFWAASSVPTSLGATPRATLESRRD